MSRGRRRLSLAAGHGTFCSARPLVVIGFALNPCNIPSSLEPTARHEQQRFSPIFLRQFRAPAALCCAARVIRHQIPADLSK